MSVICYTAIAMTGKNRKEICEIDAYATNVLKHHGIIVLSPVAKEHVTPEDKPLVQVSEEILEKLWKDDKAYIRQAHVLLDLSGFSISEGVRHEIGYSRYALFLPTIRIHPKLGISVARLEDDLICETVEEAAVLIAEKFGSRWKRVKWRFSRQIPFKWVKLLFRQFVGMFR